MRAGPAGRSVGTMAGSSGSGSSFVGSLLVRMKGYNILYVIFCVKYFDVLSLTQQNICVQLKS